MTDVQPIRKAKKKPKVPTKTQQLKKCDVLFSLIIRSRGACEVLGCPSRAFLQCAHGFSRRYRAVRFDERNAFCLCRGHHVYYTHRPLEWDNWLRAEWGEAWYFAVRHQALSGPNPDLAETLTRLKARYEETVA